jgi:hypothetical protein
MLDGWIVYDGNGQPVSDNTPVNWRYRGQELIEPFEEFDDDVVFAKHLDWNIEEATGDITHYRVVEE